MSEEVDGILVFDKPLGISSRAAVDLALKWFPNNRIGHAGTLDPLATGVLVLCLGQATRLVEYVQRMDKVYQAGVRFGVRSTTDDAEGELTSTENVEPFGMETLIHQMDTFRGVIEQVPPAYSAARVAGRRAYALARKGKEVVLSPRSVQIYDLIVQRFDFPDLELEVRCGKGTYIRSLARDLGEKLGCGAYLTGLRRTRIGPFTLEQALSTSADEAEARKKLLPLETTLADLPQVQLTSEEAIRRFCCGTAIALHESAHGPTAVYSGSGRFLGVGAVEAGVLSPDKIFYRPGT